MDDFSPNDSHPIVSILQLISHNMGKCNKTHGMGKVWEIDSHTCFFPLDSHHHLVYFIMCETHGFSHQISQSPSNWECLGNRFPYFLIPIPSCHIIYHMENAWVFLSILQGMGNSRKTHRMGKAWKMDFQENTTKPIVCREPGKLAPSYFSHSMGIFFNKILWYTFMWNTWWVSPPISNSTGKCSKIHQIGRA